MPKQKTHSGAKKRFRVTRNGKVMSKKRNANHILEKKSPKRKRNLRGTSTLADAPARQVKKMLNQ